MIDIFDILQPKPPTLSVATQSNRLIGWEDFEEWCLNNSCEYRTLWSNCRQAGISEQDRLKITLACFIQIRSEQQEKLMQYARKFGTLYP